MFKALYFKEMKHIFYTSRPAIIIFTVMMLLTKTQKVSGVINLSLIAGALSLIFVSGVFMEEKKNKTLDILLVKPVDISVLIFSKYLAVISMSLPGWIYSSAIFMARFPKFFSADLTMILSVNLLLLHLAFYDTLRHSLPGASKSKYLHVIIKAVIMLFISGGVLIWIYAVSKNVPPEYVFVSDKSLIFFKIFSFVFSLFLLFASFKTGSKRIKKMNNAQKAIEKLSVSNRIQIVNSKEKKRKKSNFSVLVLMQIKRIMPLVFLTLGIGLLLNILAGYIGKDSQIGSLGMTGVVIIAALFFPLLPFFNNYIEKTFDYLHARPVSRSTVMLSFGASSMAGVIIVYLFTLVFVRLFPVKNLLDRGLSFGFISFLFCVYLCTFWFSTVFYTKKYCKSGKGFLYITFFIALFFVGTLGILVFFPKFITHYFYKLGLTINNTAPLAALMFITGIIYNYCEASGRIRRIESRVPLILFLVVIILTTALSLKPLSGFLAVRIYRSDLSEDNKKKYVKNFLLQDYLAENVQKDEKIQKISRIMKSVEKAYDYYSGCLDTGGKGNEYDINNFYIPLKKMLAEFKTMSIEEAGALEKYESLFSDRLFSYSRALRFSKLISLLTVGDCPVEELKKQRKKIELKDSIGAILKYAAIVENSDRTLWNKIICLNLEIVAGKMVVFCKEKGLYSASDKNAIKEMIQKRNKQAVTYYEAMKKEIDLIKQSYLKSEKKNPRIYTFYKWFHDSPISELDEIIKIKRDYRSSELFDKRINEFGSFTKALVPKLKNIDMDFVKREYRFSDILNDRVGNFVIKPFDYKKSLGYDWNSFKFKKQPADL